LERRSKTTTAPATDCWLQFKSSYSKKMRQNISTILAIVILNFGPPNSVSAQSEPEVINYGNNKEAGSDGETQGITRYPEVSRPGSKWHKRLTWTE
jgi:hypothetical protein